MAENEFSLSLGGIEERSASGPSARTVANVLSHFSAVVERLGELSSPNSPVRLEVRGFRRGSLLIGLAVQLADELARASPTTHFFVCGTLFELFRRMAALLHGSAKVPPSTAGSASQSQLAEKAIADAPLMFSLGAAFESASEDREAQVVGIVRPGQSAPEVQLPADYFSDPRTGLALPSGFFEVSERVTQKDVPIWGSRPDWWRSREAVCVLERERATSKSPFSYHQQAIGEACGQPNGRSGRSRRSRYSPDA